MGAQRRSATHRSDKCASIPHCQSKHSAWGKQDWVGPQTCVSCVEFAGAAPKEPPLLANITPNPETGRRAVQGHGRRWCGSYTTRATFCRSDRYERRGGEIESASR